MPSAEKMASVAALDQPFDAAIAYFQGKVDLPTRAWTDLWEGMHARAFVVAGAMKSDLLADLRGAVDKALTKGTTFEEFRKDFDAILDRTGWQPRGGRAWRAGVIFNTNVNVAYAAGHYAQMTDPDVLRARPWWRYVASSSREKRPEHTAWYNTVLPADDPWWRTHYPPNGWGCKCGVTSHSAAELERLQAQGVNLARQAPADGEYSWTNPATGEILQVPKGIDPGWAYNPGEAAWGRKLSEESMAAWQKQGAASWERLTPGDAETFGRPARIPEDAPRAQFGRSAASVEECAAILRDVLGGEQKVCSYVAASGWRHDLVVEATSLAGHIDLARAPYLPFLPETLENPFEVWAAFERHRGTGKVELRMRLIKGVNMGKKPGMLVVAQARDGVLEAWTVVPVSRLSYLDGQRVGRLVWGR